MTYDPLAIGADLSQYGPRVVMAQGYLASLDGEMPCPYPTGSNSERFWRAGRFAAVQHATDKRFLQPSRRKTP